MERARPALPSPPGSREGQPTSTTRRKAVDGRRLPPKRTRRWTYSFSPALYRGRNAIERMVCRLKEFRRIAAPSTFAAKRVQAHDREFTGDRA